MAECASLLGSGAVASDLGEPSRPNISGAGALTLCGRAQSCGEGMSCTELPLRRPTVRPATWIGVGGRQGGSHLSPAALHAPEDAVKMSKATAAPVKSTSSGRPPPRRAAFTFTIPTAKAKWALPV